MKVPAGGSVEPASHDTVDGRRHFLDVADPAGMKGGLDEVSLSNFVAAAEGALARSGAVLADVSYLCGIHMKRSMHEAIAFALGIPLERVAHLDDTGHMSGVDPLLALDRAVRAGDVTDGDLVLLLAAGTGYTWAASVVRWGQAGTRRRRRRRPKIPMSVFTELIGQELGPTEWLEVDQARIDEFARRDRRPPVDPRRPRARGRGAVRHDDRARLPHALPVVPLMAGALKLTGYRMGINYGVNRVRFPAPLPSGSRVRGRLHGPVGRRGRRAGSRASSWPSSSARAATSPSASRSSSCG